jgi:hypothetical protein
MNNHAKIKIQNLNVYAEKQQILKNINIEIPKNKITVILGQVYEPPYGPLPGIKSFRKDYDREQEYIGSR